ncbi:MAG: ABC transporter permease [Prolixibacteraceae bacterium]|nr:ABC transporter permease [Prolixibacteraceae bacterium]
MIKNFIIIAWRNIKRNRTLSAIQLLCLSVGLAAFILLARYVQYEKDWDKFNSNFRRIYRVQSHRINDKMNDSNHTPVPLAKFLTENIPEVENAIMLREVYGEYLSSGGERTFFEEDGYLAPESVFDMFSFKIIKGEKEGILDRPNSIVLNETLAAKYFPDENPVGKILLDERKRELVVTGVMENMPEQSSIQASYFKSSHNLLNHMGNNWTNNSYRTFVLLKPNTSCKIVSEKIKHIENKHDVHARRHLYLKPLSELHLKEGPRDDRGSIIYYFSFLGILTLLLACVSFMNLTTSFSSLRSLEIGIRKTTGSSRKYIVWQFLSEAVIMALISFVIGLVIAYLILPLFNQVVNRNIELRLFRQPLFLIFLLVSSLITGLIAGSYPALIISRFKPVTVLKGKSPFKKGRIHGMTAMVYFQFFLSIILITSSIWMYKQVNFLKNMDVGFKTSSLIRCRLPETYKNVSYEQIRQKILSNPNIEDLSISINSPMLSSWGTEATYEGGDPENRVYFRWNQACEHFINTMEMEIVEGRNFSEEYASDNNKCLINETAARQLGWENPLGKWINREGIYTVIGVIKDFNIEDVHNPIRPYFLLLHPGNLDYYNDLTFKIIPGSYHKSKKHIESVLNDLFPNLLFEVTDYKSGTEDDAIRIWTSAQRTFLFFAVLAVIIAGFGLFGLVVFVSQRKTKEIGIRKVQGAKTVHILPLLTRQFLILILLANLNVFPIAYILEKTTPGQFKYQFSVLDVIFVLALSVLIILLSSGYQAIKAARLNPVNAMRYE